MPLLYEWIEHASLDYSFGVGFFLGKRACGAFHYLCRAVGAFGSCMMHAMFVSLSMLLSFFTM